jgi:hypothetical protein
VSTLHSLMQLFSYAQKGAQLFSCAVSGLVNTDIISLLVDGFMVYCHLISCVTFEQAIERDECFR